MNQVNYKQFQTRIEYWEKIFFTSIIYSKYGADFEIYAIDENSNAKSRIFICYADNEAEAHRLVDQFSAWLPKINAGRKRLHSARQREEAQLPHE
ncbi:hypothetical protein [Candidatus Pantoea deserta]|uniref:hypothetical protein n=1 Tax=Candidatus Pantoea deserta TaxID=1869313 RepID=UPI001F26B1FE|nr:hypothetical protein [Pantoea deserta]